MVDERGRVRGRVPGRDDVAGLLVRRHEVEEVDDGVDQVEEDESEDGTEEERDALSLEEK